jgi:hypothetical protein
MLELSLFSYNFAASWHMRVICTSVGVIKMLGCALSIEKYGIMFHLYCNFITCKNSVCFLIILLLVGICELSVHQ